MVIKELQIFTDSIKNVAAFYGDLLGFKVLQRDEDSISFQAGKTVLRFLYSPHTTPYHFAFNIPSNAIEEAHIFLQGKVDILNDGYTEIFDFDTWNARAIYFYDQDKNIVECIARKNLSIYKEGPFSIADILGISEMGMPVNDIQSYFDQIKNTLGLVQYSGNKTSFCAQGTETGLFILIDKNNRKWFPKNDNAFEANFKMIVSIQGQDFIIKNTPNDFSIKDYKN